MTSTITARRLLRGNEIRRVSADHRTRRPHHVHPRPGTWRPWDSYPRGLLAPSYLNIHVHGAVGHDVMEGTPEALQAIAAALAGHGVGGYYPTTVTSSIEDTLRALDRIAGGIEGNSPDDGAAPLGIHLEGPFLSVAKRGVHTAALLAPPSISLFDRFWQAARGQIRIMTIAPELSYRARVDRACQQPGRGLQPGTQRR